MVTERKGPVPNNSSFNAKYKFSRVTLEKRLIFERGPQEPRSVQKTFTTEPKIRRRVKRHRVIYRRAKELVESFYPETLVSYEAMRLRMITEFELGNRLTILAYLGRPPQVKVERIDHDVRYVKSGTITNKVHTFKRRLPARKGYVEIFGFATMVVDREGKAWFRLHHMKQETLDEKVQSIAEFDPPSPLSESEQVGDKKGSIDNLSLSLYGVQQAQGKSLEAREKRDERESIKCDINSESESNRARKLGRLTPREEMILRLAKDPGG